MLSVTGFLVDKITHDQNCLKVLLSLTKSKLKPRHEQEINEILGVNADDTIFSNETCISTVLAFNPFIHEEKIYSVLLKAEKEKAIEQSLLEVENVWKTLKFPLCKYKKLSSSSQNAQIYIIDNLEEVFQILDDNLMTIQGVSSSKYLDNFKDKCAYWENFLTVTYECLEVILLKTYIYNL